MKQPAVFFICCLLFTACCFSQDFNPPVPKKDNPQEKEPFWSWDKVSIGGGLGIQFGNITYVNVAPDVGYRITEKYIAGIGIRYMYYADNTYSPPYELNIYGGSIFNRYIINKFLFLHGEYELLNGPWNPYSNSRFNLNNVWAGGGLRQGTDGVSLMVMALWNLNDEGYLPNPQLRVGLSIGL